MRQMANDNEKAFAAAKTEGFAEGGEANLRKPFRFRRNENQKRVCD